MGIHVKSISAHRVVFVGLLLIPALITQTIWPLVSHSTWEDIGEAIFPFLMTFKSASESKASDIFIIKVGEDSKTELGLPIGTENFIGLLDQLKESGHPYVLSLLRFSRLEEPGQSEISTLSPGAENSWISAVSSYGKFIGSPLELVDTVEHNDPNLESLLSMVSFTKEATVAANLGSQPIQVVEMPKLVQSEKTFGFRPTFEINRTVNCFQPYIGDAYGDLAIPTSLLWAAAYAGQANMILGNGAIWPRKGEKVTFSFKRQLDIEDKHCVIDPNLNTSELLSARGIAEMELSKVLKSSLPDLKGKIVILAADESLKYQGPGSGSLDESIATDYQLVARFLDGLLTGDTIRRQRLVDHKHFDWLPIMIALMLATMSFFFGSATLAGLTALSFIILIGYTAFQLTVQNQYVMPIQSIASTFFATIGVLSGQLFLRGYGLRRTKSYSKKLDSALAQCVNLNEIIATAVKISRSEFQVFELELSGYNKAVYYAASDTLRATKYLKEFGLEHLDAAEKKFGETSGRFHTVLTTVKRPPDAGRLALGSRGITAKIAINGPSRRIGTAEVLLSYKSHEELFVADMINSFQQQLSTHWGRVDANVRKMLVDLAKTLDIENQI